MQNLTSFLLCVIFSPNQAARALGTGVGVTGVVVASLILSFYGVIAGWMIAYLLESIADIAGLTRLSNWLTAQTVPRDLIFMGLFMALTIAIISRGVTDGIEKWSRRLMPVLFVILVALIVYVLSQKGGMTGLKVYLIPDFNHLSAGLVLDAMGQAFFSLSLGVGTMLIYGSYISDKENLPKLGVMVTLVDTGIAFIAGLLIIPAMYVALHYGTEVFNADGSLMAGPGLIFQILPALFNSMGGLGTLVAFAFFLLMTIASLTSSISMLEVPVSLTVEKTGYSRPKATWLIGGLIAIISAVIIFNFGTLFDFIADLTTKYSQPLLGLMLCVFAGWLWSRNSLLKELKKDNPDAENGLFWKIWPNYVKFVCPLLILANFAQSLGWI